jgi:hypothetical protein
VTLTKQGVRDLNVIGPKKRRQNISDDQKRFAGMLPKCKHELYAIREESSCDNDGLEYRDFVPYCIDCGDRIDR